MANTYVDYTAVASQTDYNFSFEYLRDEHVKVKVNGTLVTNYTIVTSPTPTKIRFNTAPVAGSAIKIYRDSRGDFSPLVDFVNGSVLTESELDESYKHNLFVSQEASEGQGGEQLTKKGLPNYDAEGNKIINLGTPTDATDAANKAYTDQTVDAAIALGGSPAIVSLGGYDVTALGTSITKSLANWTNDLNSPIATGSTTARSLADRFAEVVNVLDYIPSSEHTAIADGTTTYNAKDDITSAVTNAAGGVLYFPSGTYKINAEIDLNNIIVKGDNVSIKHHTSNAHFLFSIDSDVTVEGIDFYGEATNFSGGDAAYSNKSCVEIKKDNNKIINCGFYELDHFGIYMGWDGGASFYLADNNIVQNCTFENATQTLSIGDRGRMGVRIGGGRYNKILNNKFKNLTVGVSCFLNDDGTGTASTTNFFENVSHNIYESNYVENMTEHGIYIASGSFQVIANNVVKNVSNACLKVRGKNNTITGNTLDSSGNLAGSNPIGIQLDESTSETTCDGNVVKSQSVGIFISGSGWAAFKSTQGFSATDSMTGVSVSNNIVECYDVSDTAIRVGIKALGDDKQYFGEGFKINNNRIIDFNTGIWIGDCGNISISDNYAKGAGTYASSQYGNGISFSDANSGGLILSNFVKNFPQDGIYLSASTNDSLLVKNNISTDNARWGLFENITSGTTRCRIIDNMLVDNTSGSLSDETTFIHDNIVNRGSSIERQQLYYESGNPTVATTAGSFIVGLRYHILSVGTTDFTTIGSADNNLGTVFTATGVGTGTGTAITTAANRGQIYIDSATSNIYISKAFDSNSDWVQVN